MHRSLWNRATSFGKSKRTATSRVREQRRLLFEQTEDRLVMAAGPLVISEFMAQNDTTLPDEDGAFSDWIEIHNTTAAPVDLTGWRLTDSAADLSKWSFPSQSLAANGYLVVFASSKNRVVPNAQLHTNFSLSVSGEYLALVKPDNSISNEFTPEFPSQVSDVSYGSSPDLTTTGYFATPTPGAANGQPVGDVPPKLVFSEIMFHPASNNDLQEWVELYNRGATTINLNGWQIDRGVSYTFPNVSIAAGQRLVVASNTAAFTALYPGVSNMVGGWTGALADSGEEIRLINPSGSAIDSVSYSDEGAWATRTRGVLDNNHQGWDWVSTADGGGKSLELVNLNLSNNYGQNWLPSTATGGSPGAANAVASTNVAPLLIDVSQFPKIPRSTDTVNVTALILDELATGITATVQYRLDGAATFTAIAMLDDGLHGDGVAGDRVFGATLPAQANGVVIEYYVQASDSTAHVRTWPAPVQPTNTQSANLLYQVDNTYDPLAAWVPGSQPIYRIIMTNAERAELATIGSGNPDAQSNARMNATFIAVDGSGISSSYLVGIRNRGHGSRIGTPNNYHLDFPHDDTWNGLTGAKLNARYTDSQTLGSAIFQQANLAAADTSPVQVRVNAQNLAQSGSVMYGSYALVEEENSEFVDKHFPNNSGGNLYSAIRDDSGVEEGDLRYEGTSPVEYDNYTKQTNQEENDWTDLITLTDVLNNAPAATYFQAVSQVVDVNQWVRFLALNTLLNNRESGLNTGVGDDYLLYRGVTDTRFQLVPHDLDSLMNRGNSGGSLSDSIFAYTNVDGMARLFTDPQFLKAYFSAIVDLTSTVYTPAVMNPLIEQTLGGFVPQATRDALKQYVIDRSAAVLAQVPRTFTIVSPLPVVNTYNQTASLTTSLSGTADVATTGSVLVNGVPATWDARTGVWSMPSVVLNRGINRVMVETYDGPNGTGARVKQSFIDIWSTAAGTNVSGALPAGTTTWTAANGPYNVTSTLTIPVGSTLVIQPGTSVFFAAGAELTVNGRLDAQGTQYNQIRFTRTPGVTGVWNGVQFVNSVQDNRISYAVLEWASPTSNNGLVGSSGSQLLLENSTLDHAERRRVRALNSNVIIRNNTFTDIFDVGVAPATDNFSEQIWGGYGLPGGYFIIEGNTFGVAKGHNDIIDIDGGLRANGDPVLQILNNTFHGGGDDAMDLEGDAHIEGNLIMNFVRDQWNTALGNSNALSAGDAHTVGHDYYLARNTFVNVQDITTVKENSTVRFFNNTIINALSGAISFNPPDDPIPGKGGVFQGNIFYNSPSPFKDFPALPANFVVQNNLITADQANLGTGNLTGDPRFVDLANLDFHLLPGSPALGTGPNGLDMGSQVARWATISGEPTASTAQTSATLTVGGPSIVAYKYRVNGGAWSAETPVATPISLAGLTDGSYTVSVAGKNDAGVWQADAAATVSKTWVVTASAAHLVLNEILASNQTAVDLGGTRPDAIELYNGGTSPINLADMSLSDDPLLPRKFVFPAGTTIPAGGYYVVYADALPSLGSELHTGFSLSGTGGETVLLYNKQSAGGALLDSVAFGVQAIDWSIGRVGQSGAWALTQPTFGGANIAARTGNPATLKINEWFTTGGYVIQGNSKSNDFIELFNPDTLPVALAGLYLSDDPVGEPGKGQIPPLSFIGAAGVHPYSAFQADSQPGQGADHLNYKLSADRGWLMLSDSTLKPIDRLLYGPQTDGYSQGRSPDGSTTIQFFAQPSPAVDLSPPSVPTNLRITNLTPTTIDLAWNASTDVETGVIEYRVYRNGVLQVTTTNLQIAGLPLLPDTNNSFRVSAVNGDNTESALSSPVQSGSDLSPPTVPAGVAGALVGSTRVDLTWSPSTDNESGVLLYTIYRNGVFLGTSNTTSYSDTALPAAGTTYYQISATNGDSRESALSGQLQIVNFQQGVYPTAAYAGTTDSYISTSSATNNGANTNIRFDGDNGAGEDRALIRWDLAALAAGGNVTSAAITVNVSNPSTGQLYNLYALNRNWVEGQVDWTNYATGLAWQTAGADGASDRGTVVLGTASSDVTGKVTFQLAAAGVAQLQQWIATPGTNFGFFITRADSSVYDAMVFDSRETATLTNRPQLAVAYSLAPVAPDTTPPTTPTGLTAVNDGLGKVVLNWTVATDPESGIQLYRVYRDNVLIGTSVTNSYTDSTVAASSTYLYRVSAVNQQNLEGTQSSSASVSTDSTPPSVPTGAAVAPDGAGHLTVSWTASTDAQSGIKYYQVYRNNTPIGTSATTSYTDLTVVAGVSYQYQVSAVNNLNLESARTAAVIGLVDSSPPTVPAGLTGAIVSATNIGLSWTASTDPQSGILLYTIYRDGVQIGTSGTTTFTDTAAQPATTSVYTVSATNTSGYASNQSPALNVIRFRDGASPTAAYAGTTDTFIDGSATTTNSGNSTTFRFDGSDASSFEERALMRWDLSAVPTGNTVSGASITVNVTNSSGGQVYNLYALKRAWTETQATWNIAATGTNWQTAGASGANDADLTTILGTVSSSATGSATFQLNAAGIAKVQSWIDTPATNFGFVVVRSAAGVNDDMIMTSRNSANVGNRPRFSLAYASATPPDTTPPTAPTNVGATDNGASQINLTWTASTDAESAVTGYNVYRDGVKIGSPTGTSYSDTNILPGKNYSYQVAAVNSVLLESDRSATLVYQIAQPLTGYTLTMSTRDSYLPGVPVLVQIEITGADGKPVKDVWDAVASLSASPGISLSTSEIRLRNGLGSALVTFTGGGPVTLTATSGGIQTQRSLTSLAGVAQTNVSGTLVGAAVSWSGIVHVTGNVTVPVGTTLTVQPGTLVLIDGNPTLLSTDGKRIIVQGKINSLGTAAQPVTFTATDPLAPWGEITHSSSQASTYQYTQINRAGHTTGTGHTGTGPVVRVTNSTLTFDHAAITDLVGKVMEADGSNLTFTSSNLARATMGPELGSSGLLFQDGYITEMLGQYREDGVNNDDDGIYLHGAGAGQTILISNSVIALVDDDAIDTLGAIMTIDRVIVRDATNPNEDAKGISVNGGAATITNTLVSNTSLGISTKNNFDGSGANTTIDRTTVVNSPIGIAQVGASNIVVTVSNSIIQATDAVQAAVTASMQISYSDVNEAWAGAGNINVDPLFVSPIKHDFHLQALSPAINTGNPAATDSDGTRVDMGAFPRLSAATIAGRRIFYNSSKFDGNSSAAGAADDAAIATGKTALLPGGTATSANYTNYSRGINGVMLDIANLSATPTAADFTFRVGNDNTPSGWALGPAPTSVTVRAGAGAGGSSRVTITWADNAIQKQWLQVTAKTSLGLAAADVFYFGNAIGESGDSAANAAVNSTDEVAARNNPKTFVNPALVTDAYDFNRDGFVNATDQILARSNSTTLATALKLIVVPSGASQLSQAAAEPLPVSSQVWLPVTAALSSQPAATAAASTGTTQVGDSATAAATHQVLSDWDDDALLAPAVRSFAVQESVDDVAHDWETELVELLAGEQLLSTSK